MPLATFDNYIDESPIIYEDTTLYIQYGYDVCERFPDFPIERWQVLGNVRDKPRHALHDHLFLNANTYRDRTGEEPTIDMLISWAFKWRKGALTQKLFPSFDINAVEPFAACRNFLAKWGKHRAYWLSESYKDNYQDKAIRTRTMKAERRRKSVVTLRQLGWSISKIARKFVRDVRTNKRDIKQLKEQGIDLSVTSISNAVSQVKLAGDISIHGQSVTSQDRVDLEIEETPRQRVKHWIRLDSMNMLIKGPLCEAWDWWFESLHPDDRAEAMAIRESAKQKLADKERIEREYAENQRRYANSRLVGMPLDLQAVFGV